MRYSFTAILAILTLQASLSRAQTPEPQPQFEVASVKLNAACATQGGRGFGKVPFSKGRLNMECTNLQNLVQSAYIAFADGKRLNQEVLEITGAPGWMQSDRIDVVAKTDGAVPIAEMMGPMLRALLEDRFKLKVHRETKEKPIYALTVAKGGFKVQPAKEGCVPIDLEHLPMPPERGQQMPNYCGNMSMRMSPQSMMMDAHGLSVKELAQRLSGMLDRPVVDETGITGQFDFRLEFAPDENTRFGGRGGGGDSTTAPLPSEFPSIFTAIQQQFGLKLAPDKGPVDFLVIDHVEKPTEN